MTVAVTPLGQNFKEEPIVESEVESVVQYIRNNQQLAQFPWTVAINWTFRLSSTSAIEFPLTVGTLTFVIWSGHII